MPREELLKALKFLHSHRLYYSTPESKEFKGGKIYEWSKPFHVTCEIVSGDINAAEAWTDIILERL